MANIILLHGDDRTAIETEQARIIDEQKATGMADMNLTVMDGSSVSLNDLTAAVYAAPFLLEKRVVILKSPLSLAGGRDGNKKFSDLLSTIPESTLLYLILHDFMERKDWSVMGKSHFLRKWLEKNPEKGQLRDFTLPNMGQMPAWILKRAAEKGGKFDASGAAALAAAIGTDTYLADREIEKLLLYVDFARPVEADDVNEIVSNVVSVSVFDMVDALAVGNSRTAMLKLHQLMEEQEFPQLFAMIVRQFRLLVQTREILDEGGNSGTVAKELGQVPFVADKLVRQARSFSMPKLIRIYHELLEMDHDFKSAPVDTKVMSDMFVLFVEQTMKSRS